MPRMKKGRLERLPYPEEEDIDDPKVPFCDLLSGYRQLSICYFHRALEVFY